MSVAYLFSAVCLIFFLAAVVYAFAWACASGQFRDSAQTARSIFDSAEPEGAPTDLIFKKKKPAATNHLT